MKLICCILAAFLLTACSANNDMQPSSSIPSPESAVISDIQNSSGQDGQPSSAPVLSVPPVPEDAGSHPEPEAAAASVYSEADPWDEEISEEIEAVHPDDTPVESENFRSETSELSLSRGQAAEKAPLTSKSKKIPANPIEQLYADEMTVRVIDEAGEPVPNIGIYVNPKAGYPLHRSLSFAVSGQDGVAVIQRIRTSFAKDEAVVLALCDRNQSKQPQQQFTMLLPEDSVTPIDIIWSHFAAKDEQLDMNRLDITVFDSKGKPVANAWIGLSPIGIGPDPSTQQTGSPDDISEYFDWQRCTGDDGKASWLGVEEGEYSVSIFLHKPPFSNVSSDHPRLQIDFERPVMGYRITVEGSQKVIINLP